MKRKNEAGFSLVEVLVAITILAAVVLPVCSSMLLAVQLNGRTDELMHAQLAVSSAVETIMAEGIPNNVDSAAEGADYSDPNRFPDVTIEVTANAVGNPTYYNVEVTSSDGLVKVETSVGAVPAQEGGQS